MKNSKYHLYLIDFEYNTIVNFLINYSPPISQGNYTDSVDNVLIKMLHLKNLK